ncbi:F0F1 ATP synthase subunit delta [Paenibacillus agilis]|uniref:ATP synthase subunit delta n=1 Tax=Paenibacillus agilis TaxID=3020863 RepID=A0A559IPI8_9BACL|nr:F0F1 ATP synthase subunit delta [Paenibacillus agilis]TVX89500.1 F0F1 ATP synthase subunit delta [Paenibacillus agilis]
MSRESVVAKRYAKALFELANERQSVVETEQQLRSVVEAVRNNHQLELLLTTPNINSSEKVDVLKAAFAGNASEIVLNTLQMLVERGRILLLGDLLDYYVRIAGQALGVASAEVRSAVALSEEEQQQIAAVFGKKENKTIRVHNIVDPTLIGGIQVRIGDRLYDGSLSGQLARVQQQLNAIAR